MVYFVGIPVGKVYDIHHQNAIYSFCKHLFLFKGKLKALTTNLRELEIVFLSDFLAHDLFEVLQFFLVDEYINPFL
jgi:cell shape-determining protein MreC